MSFLSDAERTRLATVRAKLEAGESPYSHVQAIAILPEPSAVHNTTWLSKRDSGKRELRIQAINRDIRQGRG